MAPSGYYEDGAAFVSEQGTTVTGSEAIREVLSGFMTTKSQNDNGSPLAVECGDTALVHSKWTTVGTGADGNRVDF